MNGDDQALTVAERLPPDLMLLRLENESIMAVARAAPRDPMKIVAQLQQLLDAYPAAADEAIYSKPVGTVQRVTCGDCRIKYDVNKVDRDTACPGCKSKKREGIRSVKKLAEGLSVRAAESIRSIYGFTRLATTTELLEDGKAKLTGVLVDYAAGNVTSDERILSPMYKAAGGQMVRTPEDRFLNVVVKGEKARLRRDVILENTPNIVKAMFRDACEKKLEGLVAPEVIEQKILPAFAEYGITVEHLDEIVGRPRALGWRERERLTLRKILNALKNEETTAAELLADLDDRSKPSQEPPSGATMEDLAGQKPEEKPDDGKPQEKAGAPAAAAGTQAHDQGSTVDAKGAEPPAQDDGPVSSGAGAEAARRRPGFREYKRAVEEAASDDERAGLLIEAEEFLTEEEVKKLSDLATQLSAIAAGARKRRPPKKGGPLPK